MNPVFYALKSFSMMAFSGPRRGCPETYALHGGSEGRSSDGCKVTFLPESSALAWGRDCLETYASHGACQGCSDGGCEGMFLTEPSALARRRDCLETHASHCGSEGRSGGCCKVMFLTESSRRSPGGATAMPFGRSFR